MRITKCEKFNRPERSRRIKIGLIAGPVVLVAIVAAAVGIPALLANHNHKAPQSVLPFTGLKGPTAARPA